MAHAMDKIKEEKDYYSFELIIKGKNTRKNPGLILQHISHCSEYVEKIEDLDQSLLGTVLENIQREVVIQNSKELKVRSVGLIIFMISFGIILGDLGYGITLILISIFLKVKRYIEEGLYKFLVLMGFTSCISGAVVFQECLGFHLTFMNKIFGHTISKIKNIVSIAEFSGVAGTILILITVTIGVINSFIGNNRNHALIEGIKTIIVFSVILIVYFKKECDAVQRHIIYLMISILLIFLAFVAGPAQLLKLPSAFIDYMSFSRIALLACIKSALVENIVVPLVYGGIISKILCVVLQIIFFLWGLMTSFLIGLRLFILETLPKGSAVGAKEIKFNHYIDSFKLEKIEWI